MQVIAGAASALAINSHGDIAGIGLNLHATIFSTKKRTTDLGTLGGDFSVAGSLNTKGHAAGYSPLTVGGQVRAFFFAGKGLQDLGTFGTGDNAVAAGVMSDHSWRLQLLRPHISHFFHVEPQSET